AAASAAATRASVRGFLLDTNVLSEARKAKRADPRVVSWIAHRQELYLSVLVTGEVRRGIEVIRRRDRSAAGVLERWLRTLEAEDRPGPGHVGRYRRREPGSAHSHRAMPAVHTRVEPRNTRPPAGGACARARRLSPPLRPGPGRGAAPHRSARASRRVPASAR